eukprot:GHVP01038558.1.p1 GENE.GHVP01038558.1~~GHVP01038558.1.p1  ORF type:complete len:287 (-),score=41.66 GHVP01038558.1:672-1532(-)
MHLQDKLKCLQFGFFYLQEYFSPDEIVIVTDDDVLFSDWNEDNVEKSLKKLGNNLVVVSAEENLYPSATYFRGGSFDGPYINSGTVIGRFNRLKDIFSSISSAYTEIKKISIQDAELPKAALSYTTFVNFDQAMFQMFYLNSKNKPLVLDADRVFSFAINDMFFWKPPEPNNCHLPKRKYKTVLPGEDVCPRLVNRKGVKLSSARGICSRDKSPGQYRDFFFYPLDCQKAWKIEGCNVSLKFTLQPLSVLQKVPNPFAIHFLDNSMKYNFKKAVEEQKLKCSSPYK